MERRKDKQPYNATAYQNGGSIVLTISDGCQRHSNIKEETKLCIRTEYSEGHGEYCSLYNPAQQPGDGDRQHKDKQPYEVTVRRLGGSLVFAIPHQCQKHLNIEDGTLLKLQTEYSENFGEYSSFWNPEQQEGDT